MRRLRLWADRRATVAGMFVFMGASGLMTQILILREALVVFQGNELTIGVILANWTLLEALGSFLAARVSRKRVRANAFWFGTLVFCAVAPVCWWAARSLPTLFAVGAETFSLPRIFLGTLLTLGPVALSHGTLFASGCALRRTVTATPDGDGETPRIVYFWDIVGALSGGVFLNFLLIPFVSALWIILGVSLVGFVGTALFARESRTARVASSLGAIACVGLAISGVASALAVRAAAGQFSGQKMVFYENSPYGNIAVARLAEQQTLFLNRVPAVVTPTPDIAEIEEYIHLPIACRGGAARVLVLSGGPGGAIAELMKYPNIRIVCCQIDPETLNVLKAFPSELTTKELACSGARFIIDDNCRYVRRCRETFDVIYLADFLPCDLRSNRLFTLDFARTLRGRLAPNGVAVCALPFSLVYPEENARRAVVCLLRGFKRAFRHVRVVPGEGRAYVLMSDTLPLDTLTAGELARKIRALGVKNLIMVPERANDLLDPFRLEAARAALADGDGPGPVNRDVYPAVLRYTLAYWERQTGSVSVLGAGLGRDALFVRLCALAVLSALPLWIWRRQRHWTAGWRVFSGGFSAMTAQLTAIFAFQSLFGNVFYEIGALVTAFMVGGAVGNRLARHFDAVPARGMFLLEWLESLVLVVLAGFFVFAFRFWAEIPLWMARAAFVAICALPGAMIGVRYPVANRAWTETAGRSAPGVIYGLDLIGGCLAGWSVGTLLLPGIGVYPTLALLALMKILGAAMGGWTVRRTAP